MSARDPKRARLLAKASPAAAETGAAFGHR